MNTLFRHLLSASTLSTLMLLAVSAHAQNFYKWVDSKGTTHYTQTPPPKGAKTTGQVKTFAGPSTTRIQERPAEQTQNPNDAQKQSPEQNQDNQSPKQPSNNTTQQVERT